MFYIMTLEAFVNQIKRHKATNEYHEAFMLCLESMGDQNLKVKACAEAYELVNKHSPQILQKFSKGYRITLKKQFDLDWVLDIAISRGLSQIERSEMSIGFLRSIPCIVIRGFMAKQRFGVSANEKGDATLYYSHNMWADDFKLIQEVCRKIVDLHKSPAT